MNPISREYRFSRRATRRRRKRNTSTSGYFYREVLRLRQQVAELQKELDFYRMLA